MDAIISRSAIYGIAAIMFAALITLTATPLVRVLAYKIGAIDIPRDNRRMHKEPVPRLGGLAIFCSFFLGSLIFCEYSSTLLVMWIGGFIIVAAGVLDDVFSIHPLVKLSVQIAVACLAVSQGAVIEFISIGEKYIPLGSWGAPLTVLWIVVLTNAINIIDGLDGLACGVSAICSVSLLAIALLAGENQFALIVAIIVGSCIGFLPFNSNPAKIFMGDTGSLFLGYILSVISVQSLFKVHTVISFAIPMSVFALPILDIVFAFFRRIFRGKNPFVADKGHIHHRLIQMGFNQKQSVRILYAICGILGISSVAVAMNRLLAAIIIIVIGFAVFFMNYLLIRNPKMKGLMGLDLDSQGPLEEARADTVPKETVPGPGKKEDER